MIKEHTHLGPHHLCQSSDELGGGIAVLPHDLGIYHLADGVPEGLGEYLGKSVSWREEELVDVGYFWFMDVPDGGRWPRRLPLFGKWVSGWDLFGVKADAGHQFRDAMT